MRLFGCMVTVVTKKLFLCFCRAKRMIKVQLASTRILLTIRPSLRIDQILLSVTASFLINLKDRNLSCETHTISVRKFYYMSLLDNSARSCSLPISTEVMLDFIQVFEMRVWITVNNRVVDLSNRQFSVVPVANYLRSLTSLGFICLVDCPAAFMLNQTPCACQHTFVLYLALDQGQGWTQCPTLDVVLYQVLPVSEK